MTDYHQFSRIYDKLNGQPHLQELIAIPLLEQLDLEDLENDSIQYHITQKPWQDLMIYEITSVIDQIGWDMDGYPGSFASYMLFVMNT